MVLTLNWDMTYKFEGTVGAYNDDAQCFKKLDLIESTSSTENFEAIRAYDFYLRINDKQKKTVQIYNCIPTAYTYRDLK